MVWVGTSGYNYPEWRGSFYPERFPEKEMLPYYAARFPTVEINYTFYRLPNQKTLDAWCEATPTPFKLTLKAPKRITHVARLRDCADLLDAFCERANSLGDKLGTLLFQLPPYHKKDVDALCAFLDGMPVGPRAAFEFRSATWHDEAVYDCLRRRNAAMCIADSEKLTTPVVHTADFGYYRLRDEGYQPADIERWAGVIAQQTGDVFVYFKHEEEGKGPEFARELMRHLGLEVL